ncbi:MAG: hypothetical protein HC913_16985 [Microscillaceae bacterium]|nr:hypothetical protein [Microscillaceae bacterium]
MLLFVCLFLPSVTVGQTIQDYYELFAHDFRRPLKRTEENWVFVDEVNNFIQIKNRKMPADAISFTYFEKEDGQKVFGFQYVSAVVNQFVVPRAEFYTYHDGIWADVSAFVCPDLSFAAFWGEQPLPPQGLQEFNLELVLPRKGDLVLAKSLPAMPFQFPYDILPKDYQKTFAKRKYKTFELLWNKKLGKFEIRKIY